MPWLIAASVPVEHGHTIICLGAADPEATGENHCSLPKTVICSASALNLSVNILLAASGAAGNFKPTSVSNTTRAALEHNTYT